MDSDSYNNDDKKSTSHVIEENEVKVEINDFSSEFSKSSRSDFSKITNVSMRPSKLKEKNQKIPRILLPRDVKSVGHVRRASEPVLEAKFLEARRKYGSRINSPSTVTFSPVQSVSHGSEVKVNRSLSRVKSKAITPLRSNVLTVNVDNPASPSKHSSVAISMMLTRSPTLPRNRESFERDESDISALPPELFPGVLEKSNGLPLSMPKFKATATSLIPSIKLSLLGNYAISLLAAIYPYKLGNTVLGYGFNYEWKNMFKEWYRCIKTCKYEGPTHLYLLPYIYSPAYSVVIFTLPLQFLVLLAMLIVQSSNDNYFTVDIGRVWLIGSFISLWVLYQMSQYRWSSEGDMVFYRSIGAPYMEEFMFSYSWKVEQHNIRTIARACWNAGVGVWIDVLKLVPGDQIRSVVRTVVRDARYAVIFLTKAYIESANCCVELSEAIQHPEKMWICFLEDMPMKIVEFFNSLKPFRVCYGLNELILLLNKELENNLDHEAYHWWCNQKISSSNIPLKNITPSNCESWNVIPKYSFWGEWILPSHSIKCGPFYLSGNCLLTGNCFSLPWYFIWALFALGFNLGDFLLFYNVLEDGFFETKEVFTFMWCFVVLLLNCAPFFAGGLSLLETRVFLHPSLQSLVSSKVTNLGRGVKVDIVGDSSDSMVKSLKLFLSNIGHLYVENDDSKQDSYQVIQVHVMTTLAHRNALLSDEAFENLDLRRMIFVWKTHDDEKVAALNSTPFTNDTLGQRMMSVLCLVDKWEHCLASSLFSAIGIKVVDSLHPSGSSDDQFYQHSSHNFDDTDHSRSASKDRVANLLPTLAEAPSLAPESEE